MGSYFSKPNKQTNIPFESLERSIEALNPEQYPTFDRSMEWAKINHIYSQQVCFQEKYISWSIVGIILLFLIGFLYITYSNNPQANIESLEVPLTEN